MRSYLLLFFLAAILMGCQGDDSPSTQVVQATVPSSPAPTETPTTTPSPTNSPTPTLTPTPSPSATPTLTPTPDPYAGLTIADLSTRSYGGGTIQIEEDMQITQAFTRSLITYPSEGLTLYGFMNTPRGEGPFPVAIVMHGYVSPEGYRTLAYTSRYADALAEAGFLTFHPNYRNWPPSDEGPDRFRVQQAVDATNLVNIIRTQAGQPGPLAQADAHFIGMMGHSMGGGITLRTITLGADIQAAVLYGSMSGDEKKNYERILIWSEGERGHEEINTPLEDLKRISPIYHLERITVPVSIHHGEQDGTVPLEWSLDLCTRLQQLEKIVECFTYPDQPHTFWGESDQRFIQRTTEFFERVYEAAQE